MKRFTVKKVPDEQVYYNFDDQVELDFENIVICGNRNFISYGDKTLIDIIQGDYYDDEVGYDYETFEMLEKVTGKKWDRTTIKGYSQGDWQDVYFTKEVSQGYLEEIENFYMGKVDEFVISEEDDEYHVFVPHDVVWEGKDSICRYLDLQPEDTVIYEDDGYEKVYRYKEIN
jgi:hypothetical protein